MSQAIASKGELGEGPEPSAASSIDLVHLSRQSLGDSALEAELLKLFDRQAQSLALRLEAETAAAEQDKRGELAHALKGAARAIGAFALAEAAERFEAANRSGSDLRAHRSALMEAIRKVRGDIASLI